VEAVKRCKRGHELSGDNLRVRRAGRYTKRECRTCIRGLQQARDHAAGRYVRWNQPPIPGLLPPEEELAILIDMQRRDDRPALAPERYSHGGKVFSVLSINSGAFGDPVWSSEARRVV
jgi:hypothetical protein